MGIPKKTKKRVTSAQVCHIQKALMVKLLTVLLFSTPLNFLMCSPFLTEWGKCFGLLPSGYKAHFFAGILVISCSCIAVALTAKNHHLFPLHRLTLLQLSFINLGSFISCFPCSKGTKSFLFCPFLFFFS